MTTTADEGRRALTIDEAAAVLRLSPRSVQRRIDDGTIRAAKIGGAVRIPPEEIDRQFGRPGADRPDQELRTVAGSCEDLRAWDSEASGWFAGRFSWRSGSRSFDTSCAPSGARSSWA